MWINLLLLVIGGTMLFYGAEWLVQGAAGMALRLGVRPLLVGLTVVSYSTSAPELSVSVSAVLRGDGPLVLGNVFGSNICNIGLILGLAILIAPPMSDGTMRGKELWVLLAATIAAPLFLLDDKLARWEALVLLAGSVAFTWITIIWSRGRTSHEADVPKDELRSKAMLTTIGVLGLSVLIGGGEAFVRGAIGLAEQLKVPPRIIGLTIVAVGTSLPELAASVVAALRGHSDIAIGNVVGSNIFNILFILGVSGTLDPIKVPLSSMHLDMGVMIVFALGAVVVLSQVRRLTRLEGGLLMAGYAGFLGALVLQTK